MRLVIDTFEFGSKFTPRFNTISISGYHIREPDPLLTRAGIYAL